MQGQGPPGGGYPPNPYGQQPPYGQPPQGGFGAPPPQNNLSQGTFDMGGGQQLRVKINGQTPENYLTNKASGMVWGWIIGLGVIAVLVIGGGILGVYIYMKAKSEIPNVGADAENGGADVMGKWDGKSPLSCAGSQKFVLTNMTATGAISASGSCHIVMTNVTLNAPISASGNAELVMTNGSVTGAIDATGNAKIVATNTKLTGKVNKSGNAKVLGL